MNPPAFDSIKLWLALFLLLPCIGCAPGDIGLVEGTVTADGQPVPNAMVTFFPRPDGRASAGLTDEDGRYELTYTRGQMGAKVGEHKVTITTAVDGGDYGDTIAKETLPAKYNLASELMEEVKPGSNTIDFDLDYEGKVMQSAY